MQDTIISSLKRRGFIDAVTHADLADIISKKEKITVYCGFDPTAETLHLGNLVALMGLAWFRKAGHNVVALIGGATGMIGDPSGKSHERALLGEETLQNNVKKITQQITTILSRVQGEGSIKIVNNRDWYQNFSCIDFLRDVGKHFRVGQMLAKESVRARIQSEEGISFTEFTYQILQAYDFYHLFVTENVLIQVGGSDQWGNITAGTDYIRKLTGKEAYGVTLPLLVKSDGQKFGKSEKGAIWLSKDHLSEYDFYQQLYRVHDSDVITLLKRVTFIDADDIQTLEEKLKEGALHPNHAQKILAEEVTRFVHGEEGLQKALAATKQLMPGHALSYTLESMESLSTELKPLEIEFHELIGQKLIDVAVKSGLVASKSEARRLIKNGGLSMNGNRIESESELISEHQLVGGKYLLFSVGKKQRSLIRVQGD